MRDRPILAAVVVVAFLLAACGEASTDEIVVEPALVPTSATVAVADSELVYDVDAAISPSGAARVAPSDSRWCLEDASGVRCVGAAAEGSAAHGVVWRPDETAIAVTWGAQDPISVIDFAAGTSVETDLDHHRVLAFSPDGGDLLGLDIDVSDQLSLLDPETLEPSNFASITMAGVPQVLWPTDEVVWGSTPRQPQVFTLAPGGEPEIVEGGLGEQLLTSVSADGRLALAIDDDVAYGAGGPDDPVLRLFDRVEGRSAGVDLPDGVDQDAVAAAQLSADGRALLVLHGIDGGDALSSAVLDAETLAASSWTTLATWDVDDPAGPAAYAANGLLRWTGGDRAWIIAETGQLLEVTLS